jgi:hypothetical protein
MNWEFYEVWSVDSDGHEELIDTTRDVKEARRWAKQALTDDADSVIIYRETEDGDLERFEVIRQ